MTILQFAKTYGMTKNKVKYYIKELDEGMIWKDDKGVIHITDEGVSKLIETTCKTTSTTDKTTSTTQRSTEDMILIAHLQEQVRQLQADKEFLQDQLRQANNRADFLTIQNLPFLKRRKALKDYNQRLLAEQNKKQD